MRKPILCLLTGAAACGAPSDPGIELIEDFATRATPLACELVDLGVLAAPTELRLATDSTWTILDAPQLQILSFDDDLRPRGRTTIPSAGPGAAGQPVSVVSLGDTAFAVAGREGFRLVVLSPEGDELEAASLGFMPHSLAAGPDGTILVTPMPFGPTPPTLLMRYGAPGWDTLPVPKRAYVDMTINAIGNAALVETLPGVGALVVHQYLAPRAFRITHAGEVEGLALPTPDDARRNVDFVPSSPLTPDQMTMTHLPAIAMTVDRLRGEVYVLTRSGREIDGRPERAILRLTDRLEFIDGFTIPVRAGAMVYLPLKRAAVVADDLDRYFVCPIPGAGPDDQPV